MADVMINSKALLPSGIANLMAEAPGWRPEVGDEIEGQVLGVKINWSGGFDPYPIVFVVSDDGEPVALHAFHTTFKNELESQRPERGDRIYVKFFGEKQNWEGPKGYDPPRIYAVLVSKPGADARSIWDTISAQKAPDGSQKAPDTSPSQFTDKPPF